MTASKPEKTIVVRAFKIKMIPEGPELALDEVPTAACVLWCECGHHLYVNDEWAHVYSPQPGGWLLVNKAGVPVYRSDEDFQANHTHLERNFYRVPFQGDLALPRMAQDGPSI